MTQQQPQEQAVEIEKQIETRHHGHQAAQLIERSKTSLLFLLLVFLGIVIAVPLIEELLFRLFLQGWLEAKLLHDGVPGARGVAIVAVSFFFAALHVENTGAIDADVLFFKVAVFTIVSLSFFALGIYFLVAVRNMKLTHCLFGTKQCSRRQLFIIAGCCLLALVVVLGVNAALNYFVPDTNTNPIPIFLFSLALGVLYSITRSLWYCILLHVCLNLTSFTVAWFSA